jgi:hypothetical protein
LGETYFRTMQNIHFLPPNLSLFPPSISSLDPPTVTHELATGSSIFSSLA